MTPFWAAANVIAGLVVVMWVLAPLLYYSNVMYSGYMPILSSSVFDDTGMPYNVSRILTADYRFDEAAYKGYSRVFMPITFVNPHVPYWTIWLTSLFKTKICLELRPAIRGTDCPGYAHGLLARERHLAAMGPRTERVLGKPKCVFLRHASNRVHASPLE